MTLDPELEEELAPLRKAVDGLRQSLQPGAPPVPVTQRDPDLAPLLPALDRGLQALQPFGFHHLGDVAHRSEGRPPLFARWFRDTPSTTVGWLSVIRTQKTEKTVTVLYSEAPAHGYAVTGHGASRLSLAPTPNAPFVIFDLPVPIATVVAAHREAVKALAEHGSLTLFGTLVEAVSIQDRHLQFRLAARATIPADDLLRADLRAVLASRVETRPPEEAALLFSRVAHYLGYPIGH